MNILKNIFMKKWKMVIILAFAVILSAILLGKINSKVAGKLTTDTGSLNIAELFNAVNSDSDATENISQKENIKQKSLTATDTPTPKTDNSQALNESDSGTGGANDTTKSNYSQSENNSPTPTTSITVNPTLTPTPSITPTPTSLPEPTATTAIVLNPGFTVSPMGLNTIYIGPRSRIENVFTVSYAGAASVEMTYWLWYGGYVFSPTNIALNPGQPVNIALQTYGAPVGVTNGTATFRNPENGATVVVNLHIIVN